MYERNALGYWLGLALCLTKVRSSRACCPATALICFVKHQFEVHVLLRDVSVTSRKHVHVMNTPLEPHFYTSKTGVCMGIPIFPL